MRKYFYFGPLVEIVCPYNYKKVTSIWIIYSNTENVKVQAFDGAIINLHWTKKEVVDNILCQIDKYDRYQVLSHSYY